MQEFRAGNRSLLRLDGGEELIGALEGFAARHGIGAAVVGSGLGQIVRATLGYWDGSRYVPFEVTIPHELVGLTGSIAREEDRPSVHLHAVLAGPEGRAVGGHVFQATVGLLAEVGLDAFPGHAFSRPLAEELGVRRLDLGTGPGRPAASGPPSG